MPTSPVDPGFDLSSIAAIATLFADIEQELLTAAKLDDAMMALTRTAVQTLPHADASGVTLGQHGRFRTAGATDDRVIRTDEVQYQLASGPCVAAAAADRVFRADDLRTDPRWPVFGIAAAELGVLSMLSFRLFLPEDHGVVAALNMYSVTADAFDSADETVGMLLATHGALAVAGTLARERAQNLQIALDSNREIGTAMGILMATYKLTRQQAFDVLRITSQETNRKLAVVAAEVVDTGQIKLPPSLRTRR
jgi:hypothetical protein